MSSQSGPLTINVLSSICEVRAASWDALVRNRYPFLKHDFLTALERNHCVGEHVGWLPRYLVYYREERLAGAIPLFEKHNSWGEFVFDHAWAAAYERYGMDYYPKLVNAIPFTPASGQRILLNAEGGRETAGILIAAARKLADEGGYSGIHSLFPDQGDFRLLNQQGAVSRNDCQFHWRNQGYRSFEDFLIALKSRKRKKIRQERRKVMQSGVEILCLDGDSADEQHWADFTRLYHNIYDRKYGMPAFNQAFFMEVASAMPQQIHLVLARRDQESVAGALMYSDGDTLYGRHWGCDQYVDCLHFELCYYQGIDLCIRRGIDKFDPGAQGEHKIARGFDPVKTSSLHWMTESPFNQAIKQFVLNEQTGVSRYIDAAKSHSPYKLHGNDSYH